MTYIKGFDSLRAISITLVLLAHLNLDFYVPNTEAFMSRVWPLMNGTLGVHIFFVISGFLITNILLNEQTKKGKINFKNFFIKRLLRLSPPIIIFLVLIGIANFFGYLTNAKDSILYTLFYIYNFVPRQFYSVELGHFWSLGVEEQFYLIWPFSLTLFNKTKPILIFIFLLIITCCIAIFIFPTLEINQLYFTDRWFIPASCPILIGCVTAVINQRYFYEVKKFINNSWLLLTLIIICFTYTLYASEKLLPLQILIKNCSIALVLLLIVHSQEKKWIQYINFTPINYIGKISYGIYVYQGFFLRTGGISEIWFQKFPLNIIFTFVIAIISYEIIEKPILKLKNNFS